MSSPPSPLGASNQDVTALLVAWSEGDAHALELLLPLVYQELRQSAARMFRRERGDHTLQPTALVHEAFLKLLGGNPTTYRDRAHFFAVASQAMRQILVDHARRRATAKRGGGRARLELEEIAISTAEPLDVLAVDLALTRLAARDAEHARLVELRLFGGLTLEETAEVMGVSVPTVKRHWRLVRAYLLREITTQ